MLDPIEGRGGRGEKVLVDGKDFERDFFIKLEYFKVGVLGGVLEVFNYGTFVLFTNWK